MNAHLETLTAISTRTAIEQRQLRAERLVEEFYRKIEAEDPAINAYLALARERASAQAAR